MFAFHLSPRYQFIHFNPSHVTGLFLQPLKISEKTYGFLMFSVGIERDRWHVMVQSIKLSRLNLIKKRCRLFYGEVSLLFEAIVMFCICISLLRYLDKKTEIYDIFLFCFYDTWKTLQRLLQCC